MNCPFCDSPAWALKWGYPPGVDNLDSRPFFFIRCLECGAAGPQKSDSWAASEAWQNKKAPVIAVTEA